VVADGNDLVAGGAESINFGNRASTRCVGDGQVLFKAMSRRCSGGPIRLTATMLLP
jgi:hypothetical protein